MSTEHSRMCSSVPVRPAVSTAATADLAVSTLRPVSPDSMYMIASAQEACAKVSQDSSRTQRSTRASSTATARSRWPVCCRLSASTSAASQAVPLSSSSRLTLPSVRIASVGLPLPSARRAKFTSRRAMSETTGVGSSASSRTETPRRSASRSTAAADGVRLPDSISET